MEAETREGLADHPLIGRTLRDTYRIDRLIDRGGMGLVFEAQHLRLKHRVAVKMLPHQLVNEPYALQRFRAEAEIVAMLQHPHIVQVTDFDTTEQQQPYIVMELLSGESLAARMERDPGLPLRFATKLTLQAASALNAVHEARIVHRDLKPANMFLTELAEDGVWLKLLDFGISKRPKTGRGLTGEHDIMGTPDYMSPELALGGAASVDHRSDQYSLAVIVYEMLSGRVPFLGRSEVEILSQVVSQMPPPLSSLVPHVPPEVAKVIHRALSKLPGDRFPTISAFATALALGSGTSIPPVAPEANVGQTLRLTSDPAVLSPESKRVEAKGLQPPRTNSGLRERTPSRKAPTVRGLSPRHELNALLGRCERAYASKNVDLAADLAEQALQLAEKLGSGETAAAIAQTTDMLCEVFETRIGQLSRRLLLTKRSPVSAGALSPEQAYMLSVAEEAFTVAELIDSSPMPRLQTLRHVASLCRRGWLA